MNIVFNTAQRDDDMMIMMIMVYRLYILDTSKRITDILVYIQVY